MNNELGEISRCYSIRYERRSKHSAARLWRAITDSSEVSRWMSYPAQIDLRVGGAYFVDFSPRSPENLDGVIVRVESERLLAYVWGLSVLEWRIEPQDDGCRYTFLHFGMAKRDIPDEEGVAAGWHVWLDDLECDLSGTPRTRGEQDESYRALAAPYRARLQTVLG